MKVGIVTYFDISNYGSVLQAYAMKFVLLQKKIDPVFIKIQESSLIAKYVHKVYVLFVTLYKILTSSSARKVHFEIRRLKIRTQNSISSEVHGMFASFVKENIPVVAISRRLIKKKAYSSEYDAFICGSDQIWSPLSLHLPSYKFLEFAPKEKRIAYAPSFGIGYIPKYNYRHVKKAVGEICHLSVREIQGADLIESMISKKTPVLLDPTMLLTGEQWRNEYRKHVDFVQRKSYVLAYFFEEPKENILQMIMDGAKAKNQDVIVVMENNKTLIRNGARLVLANPWQFLELVDHADYVFTNSFHGSVFSVLFNKPFTVFNRAHSDNVKQTSRIDTLLNIAGLECYSYRDGDVFHAILEPNEKNIDEKRRDSLSYLLKALKLENVDESFFA